MLEIDLVEYEKRLVAEGLFPAGAGEWLWHHHHHIVQVDFPSIKTGGQWQLTAQGYVGYLQTAGLRLTIQPKVALDNLFRMVEYAYRLPLTFMSGVVGCGSLADFYERLALVLALRVLDRARQGFYRAYVARQERLPVMRGRLDMAQTLSRPEQVNLACAYEELVSDVIENQIFYWTLHHVLGSGLCSERVLPTIRRAWRSLHGLVTPTPVTARECVGRVYHRLNEDYRPGHLLCRFFLENSGPAGPQGQHLTLPFLLNMAQLYELFVAEWLQKHLPAGYSLKTQESVLIDPAGSLRFEIDLVLYAQDRPVCVLDTKYKAGPRPTPDDISQVVTYAVAKNCPLAVLIYPVEMAPAGWQIGYVRLAPLTFALSGNLEENGRQFLAALLNRL